jgi:hypothetical protein
VLLDGLVLLADALIEPDEVAAAVSAAESGFGEQAASATKLIKIAAIFAAEGQVVIVIAS